MVNCERCKEKITLSNISFDEETGKTRKYCRTCAEILQKEEIESMAGKKEKEDNVEQIPKENDQEEDKSSPPESDLVTERNIKPEKIKIKNQEMDQVFTDLVPRDILVNRLNSYLNEDPLNIGENDYCYIRIVGNHIEIGRAKITLEE
jgi:hypothetical protein